MAPKLRSALRAPERPTSDGLTAAIKRANPRQVCLGRTPPKARCSAPTGPTSTRRMPWLENCDRRFVLQRVAQAGGGRAHIGRGVSVGAEYRKTNEGNIRKKGLCACLPPQGYNKVPLGCLSNDHHVSRSAGRNQPATVYERLAHGQASIRQHASCHHQDRAVLRGRQHHQAPRLPVRLFGCDFKSRRTTSITSARRCVLRLARRQRGGEQ